MLCFPDLFELANYFVRLNILLGHIHILSSCCKTVHLASPLVYRFSWSKPKTTSVAKNVLLRLIQDWPVQSHNTLRC